MKRTAMLAAIAQDLAARDPRAAISSTLALVQQTVGARAAALFDSHGHLIAGQGVSQVDLDWVRDWDWKNRPVTKSPRAWVEVIGDGHEEFLVYLSGDTLPEDCRNVVGDVAQLLAIAGSQVARMSGLPTDAEGLAPAVAAFLAHTPKEQVDRFRLLYQLRNWEWNVSAVARARGTTRVTVYRLMERLGITRERVPKSR